MENVQTVPGLSLAQKVSQLLEKYPIILQLLRFGAIGVFNTAMDVLVLNYMSAQFGVTKGSGLGWVNLPGFVLAVVQSYFWNKYWAFSQDSVNLLKNFLRLASVGVVGVIVYGLVALGGHNFALPIYFLGIFAVFILAQILLWYAFGFFKQQSVQQPGKDYIAFFVVSAAGFLINSLVLYAGTTHFVFSANSGDNLNIGKIIATAASLVWNFIGYKIFVFKK